MAVESETEAKFELAGAPEWDRLRSSLGPALQQRSFRNRYYGVRPDPVRKDWVLRLRLEAQQSVLTLKIGTEVQPGLFRSLEFSETVDPEAVDWEASEPMVRFRSEISTAPLICLGEAVNHREVYPSPLGGFRPWEVDLTRFPDGSILYELETELLEQAGDEGVTGSVSLWLEATGVKFQPSRTTKFARFLNSIGGRD